MSSHYGNQPPSYPYPQGYPARSSYATTTTTAHAYPYGSTSMAPNLSQQSNSSRNSNESGYSHGRHSSTSSSYASSPGYSPSNSHHQSGQAGYFERIAETSTSSSSQQRSSDGSNSTITPTHNPTPTPKATPFPCLHPFCPRQFARSFDLARHTATHFPEVAPRYDCPEKWCGRVGKYGFTRKDHLRQHRRDVHVKDIPKGKRG